MLTISEFKTKKFCSSGESDMCAVFSIPLRPINYHMISSVPRRGEERKRWLDAIRTHQKIDEESLRIEICELHFSSDNIDRSANHKLKKRIAPSIFPTKKGIYDRSEMTLILCR